MARDGHAFRGEVNQRKIERMGLPGRYKIELCGEGGGIDVVIDSDDRFDTALSYLRAVMNHPNRWSQTCFNVVARRLNSYSRAHRFPGVSQKLVTALRSA